MTPEPSVDDLIKHYSFEERPTMAYATKHVSQTPLKTGFQSLPPWAQALLITEMVIVIALFGIVIWLAVTRDNGNNESGHHNPLGCKPSPTDTNISKNKNAIQLNINNNTKENVVLRWLNSHEGSGATVEDIATVLEPSGSDTISFTVQNDSDIEPHLVMQMSASKHNMSFIQFLRSRDWEQDSPDYITTVEPQLIDPTEPNDFSFSPHLCNKASNNKAALYRIDLTSKQSVKDPSIQPTSGIELAGASYQWVVHNKTQREIALNLLSSNLSFDAVKPNSYTTFEIRSLTGQTEIDRNMYVSAPGMSSRTFAIARTAWDPNNDPPLTPSPVFSSKIVDTLNINNKGFAVNGFKTGAIDHDKSSVRDPGGSPGAGYSAVMKYQITEVDVSPDATCSGLPLNTNFLSVYFSIDNNFGADIDVRFQNVSQFDSLEPASQYTIPNGQSYTMHAMALNVPTGGQANFVMKETSESSWKNHLLNVLVRRLGATSINSVMSMLISGSSTEIKNQFSICSRAIGTIPNGIGTLLHVKLEPP